MRKTLALFIAVFFLFLQSGRSLAAQTSFMLTAVVPASLDSVVTAVRVQAGMSDAPATALNFDPLVYKPALGIWLSQNVQYFVITVAGSGGAGMPMVDLTYSDTGNLPQPHALGWKSNINFMRVQGNTELPFVNHQFERMNQANGEHITPAEVGSGYYLKMYIGLATGATGVPGEPFVNTDTPGAYTGTLVVTTTPQ